MKRREFDLKKNNIGAVTLSPEEALWIQNRLDEADVWVPDEPTDYDLKEWSWTKLLGRDGLTLGFGRWRPADNLFQALECVEAAGYTTDIRIRGKSDMEVLLGFRYSLGMTVAYHGPLHEAAAARGLMLALYREVNGGT